MPRRPPARLRRVQQVRSVREVPGAGPGVARALDRLERPELSSSVVAAALEEWILVCRRPARDLQQEHGDRAGLVGPLAGDRLDTAVRALPRQHGRRLLRAVRRWDERFLAHTTPNPGSGPRRPWWWRRGG